MRIVFSGAGPMSVITARALIEQSHEVVIIEVDKEKIDRLSDELDCSFVHGDASKPAILSQVNPKDCDFLFCLTDSDQANIITALLGRSMGFKRVVPSIEDIELQQLCNELELEDTIIPVRTMSQYLENMVRGLDTVELSTFLKHGARFFTFVAGEKENNNKISELDFPEDTQVVFFYRDDQINFADNETALKESDEVVILTHSKHLTDLEERWNSKQADKDD
ncbi:MAG: TrkA family potassium uptake protein [Desulfobacterales bacterium]|jgi:trk system potassium uptake protein TrkA